VPGLLSDPLSRLFAGHDGPVATDDRHRSPASDDRHRYPASGAGTGIRRPALVFAGGSGIYIGHLGVPQPGPPGRLPATAHPSRQPVVTSSGALCR
jgi:hypothetical protein